MKMAITLILMFFVLSLQASVLATASHDEGRAYVTVKDESGAPLAASAVTVTRLDGRGNPQTKQTFADGRTQFLVLDATLEYKITIAKEGYKTIDEAIKFVPNDTIRVEYVLKK